MEKERDINMNIATILFTYNRSRHVKTVLDALKKNIVLPEKLYIFQDGMKETAELEEWKQVGEVIKAVDWCDTEIIIAEKNKGLANSIVSGINYVLEKNDAVIVLEDDCVPHPDFMLYMISGLKEYKDTDQVYSISGYSWPVNLDKNGFDAYFTQKICSYGWGTWKNRWNQFERDFMLLSKIKKNPDAADRLAVWGGGLQGILMGNLTERYDSWAVFWALKVIERNGYCLAPYEQLIYNIGFDGSGRHGAILQESLPDLDKLIVQENHVKKHFCFPDVVESTKECETEFQFLFGTKVVEEKLKLYQELLLNWLNMKQENNNIWIPDEWGNCIAVWGKGDILDCLLHEIDEQVEVKYIVESRPSIKEYKGIPIISISMLPDYIKDIVVIPYFDLEIIENKVKKLRKDIRFWGIDKLVDGKYL